MLEPIIRSHYEEAPTGVKRATIDTAIRRQAESPGRTFAGGQMSYLPGFGGKVKEGGAAGMGNGSCVVLPGQRVSAAHVALSIAAAHQADATACDAGEANLMSDDFRARTHALATRKFTGNPHWSSSKLLPATQDASRGTTRAALALGFGPFEKGITTGLIGKTGTTAADLPLYLGVVTVLTWMRILDAPSIDEGFREELSYWIENTPRFRNHAVPFCLVAKELGLLLTTSQRQRDEDLMSFQIIDRSDTPTLHFRVTPEIERGKRRLESYTKAEHALEQCRMDRMIADEISRGGWMRSTNQPPHQAASEPRQPKGRDYDQPPAKRPRQQSPTPKPAGVIKKEPRPTPPKTPKPGPKPAVFDQLPKPKWHRAYGSEKDSTGRLPCWFHCNRPGGCLNVSDNCTGSHTMRPKDHGGKSWEELDPTRRTTIERKTAAA